MIDFISTHNHIIVLISLATFHQFETLSAIDVCFAVAAAREALSSSHMNSVNQPHLYSFNKTQRRGQKRYKEGAVMAIVRESGAVNVVSETTTGMLQPLVFL